jgi:prepilin-type N-terminal cleavage/methylation domain-containing protein
MKVSRTAGFTITELMMVIAITGTLLSIATISSAAYIRSMKLRTAIYAVDSDIRQARWIAQCSAETCFIRFDASNGSYTINDTHFTKLPDGIRFGVAPGVTGCPGAPLTPPPSDGISFDSSGHQNTLNYYPTGAVVPGGTLYLTDGIQTMAVRVARTGRPKLWRTNHGNNWIAM